MNASVRFIAMLVVSGIGVLAFLAMETQSVDLQQHADYSEALIHLKELDARLNAGVLESRFELATSYDELVAAGTQSRAVQAQLESPPGFVDSTGRRDLKQYLNAYSQAADEKQRLIERFKTENAVFRNSLHYLPVLYGDIRANAAADRLDPSTLEEVGDIVRSVLLYNLTGEADLAAEVSRHLAALEGHISPSAMSDSDQRLRLFAKHVSVILERKATLDQIGQELVSIPTTQRADALRVEYTQLYDRALGVTNVFRIALLGAAALLLLGTMVMLAKWRSATNALRFQARHDSLTGLANRVLLQTRLKEAIRIAQRNGKTVSLVLIDLDRFKEVNDTLGHHAGDELLKSVATRLQETLRPSDTVARLGGDEFAIVLPGADEQNAIAIVRKVLRRLEDPCTIDGHSVDLEASAGIAVTGADGFDVSTMLRHADVAMYVAKGNHSGFAVYSPEQDGHNADRLGLVAELRSGIETNQLVLHYQPKLDCLTGEIAGVEALVRWQHPERGLIPPDQFIPLAEQTGLIDPLTRWVLENALHQCSVWRAGGLQVPVAINLSVHSLQDSRLTETVTEVLSRRGVPASWLTLEITESAIMADPPRALKALSHLRELGVRVALDDFGTGYSSLAYLKEIPADDLKIDRSFTKSMVADPTGRAIVRTTIELGHSLGLRVVAEGIEDEATCQALADLSCDEGQGYHIARPLPPDQLVAWLRTRSAELDAAA
jgi:diguanylate cyclase (GGDEF)-like protein